MTPPANDLKANAAAEGLRIGPLAGIRVIELGTLLAGPFTGRLLGDLGAEIIKVEAPGKPDPIRELGQGALPGPLALVAGAVAQQEVHHAQPPRGKGAGAAAAARRAGRRRDRELPAWYARALEPRLRADVRRQPRHRAGPRLRLRTDRARMQSAPALPPSPRQWVAFVISTASPTSRRPACTSRSATRWRRCSRPRASWPLSTGATEPAEASGRSSTSR